MCEESTSSMPRSNLMPKKQHAVAHRSGAAARQQSMAQHSTLQHTTPAACHRISMAAEAEYPAVSHHGAVEQQTRQQHSSTGPEHGAEHRSISWAARPARISTMPHQHATSAHCTKAVPRTFLVYQLRVYLPPPGLGQFSKEMGMTKVEMLASISGSRVLGRGRK